MFAPRFDFLWLSLIHLFKKCMQKEYDDVQKQICMTSKCKIVKFLLSRQNSLFPHTVEKLTYIFSTLRNAN
jgi:hypothetical protein